MKPRKKTKPKLDGAATVLFSPNRVFHQGIAAKVISGLWSVQDEIKHWAYSFTNAEIKDAIKEAIGRGVTYQGVWDEGSTHGTQAQFHDEILQAGAQFSPPSADINLVKGFAKYGIMHEKIFAFDRVIVYGGSYNWTRNAEENNWEVLNIFVEPDTVAKYVDNFLIVFAAGRPEVSGLRRPAVRFARRVRALARPQF